MLPFLQLNLLAAAALHRIVLSRKIPSISLVTVVPECPQTLWREKLLAWTARYRDQMGRAPPCGVGSWSRGSHIPRTVCRRRAAPRPACTCRAASTSEVCAGTCACTHQKMVQPRKTLTFRSIMYASCTAYLQKWKEHFLAWVSYILN